MKDYLDIGTCTGRYPFNLSHRLLNASILGIDADDDCIEFSNIQKQKFPYSTKNILFKRVDFLYDSILNSKFELITCMLGTISHFGWNKNENFEDDLQVSLNKMNSLLNINGILVISNWTEFALSGNILEIYNEYDRKRLQNFTEKIGVLKKRLDIYFDVVNIIRTPDNNLDILFCKKKIL